MKKIIYILSLQVILLGDAIYNDSFHFHGNFCGKNTPSINAKSGEEEIKILKTIKAIDIIDKACKAHDICYIVEGSGSMSCDKKLIATMDEIHDKLESNSCRRLSKSITYFFTIKNDNAIEVFESDDSIAQKMVKAPSRTFMNMLDSASMSSVMAMNYGFSKPVGYMFDSKKNSQRKREILQIFPPRYKECTTKQ